MRCLRKTLDLRLATLTGMVLATAALRLLPHPPNFTPIGAVALFAGAQFPTVRAALAVPLAAMLLSDLAYEALFGWGLHAGMLFVYPSFAAIVLLGRGLRDRRRSPVAIGSSALAATALFYVATNFGVWLLGGYPPDAAGLVACYAAALPFLAPMATADLFYSAVLFGGLALLERRFPRLAPADARERV